MDGSLIAVCALVISLALVMAEFFIPSGGMISIIAAVAFAIAMWSGWQAWGETSPTIFVTFLITAVVLVPASAGLALYVLPGTRLGREILLEAPTLEDVTPYAEEEQRLRSHIGRTGEAISLLNPGGMVRVDDERFHCESRGLVIEPGASITVVDVRGNRLVVRLADDSLNPASGGEYAQNTDGQDGQHASDEPLDFDVPQG